MCMNGVGHNTLDVVVASCQDIKENMVTECSVHVAWNGNVVVLYVAARNRMTRRVCVCAGGL